MNQTEVARLFEYRDGGLFWRISRRNKSKVGHRAGRLLKTGYRSIHVSGRRYQEHRLIYVLHHGVTPSQIDHVNGMKADNRIENLRPATHSTNQMNTPDNPGKSGFRGVREKAGRWSARVYLNGKEIRVGTFATAEEASLAYRAKARELFADFAR